MKELLLAIQVENNYNKMDFEELVKEFEEYTGQLVSKEIIVEFNYSGLTNIDFLTSDFLIKFGLKNLLQY